MSRHDPSTGQKRDTGYKQLLRESKFNFLKWGQYMKRAQLAERKIEKLKRLILLTDPAVSSVEMNTVSARQWSEFVREFPDEGAPLINEGQDYYEEAQGAALSLPLV